jgi:predicted ATPase/class 3 adenylate cyclase
MKTLTFLFSDMEGSTQLMHSLSERYADVLEGQRGLIRAVLAQWQGEEVDTAGDGFFAVFDRAQDAVRAASEIQRAVSAQRWPENAAVRIRIGLHTGGALPSGGTYVGLAVHLAARLMAAGHGGQVLLSQVTRELVQHELPAHLHLKDLGIHRLKDIPHVVRISTLLTETLPADFPPIKTLSHRPNNLPVQPNVFLGREQELTQLEALLQEPGTRLVTLIGPGGIGKTRLAIEVGYQLLDVVPDGIWFIDLAATLDPAMIEAAMIKSLGVRERPDVTLFERLCAFLESRDVLLILDNFEQVVEGASLVARLMSTCPRVRFLVTSRISLQLRGEKMYPLAPLACPDAGKPDVAQLSEYSAVQLFIHRAQDVQPAFALTDEQAEAVVGICRALDGLPLAIELAAARISLLPPSAILARLGHRLAFLKGGFRDLPERHQTLTQAIAWSYDLLSPAERAFFRRLSVFQGGFTMEAAESVALVDKAEDALELLFALVNKSLVRQEVTETGEPRFTLLQTIQEFGTDRLADERETDGVKEAHAAFFLRRAEASAPQMTSTGQKELLLALDREDDNFRTALERLASRGEAEAGLRCSVALWRFWMARGRLVEGRHRLQRFLDLFSYDGPSALRARALNALGTLLHQIGDMSLARQHQEEAMEIWTVLGEDRELAITLNGLGFIVMALGDADLSERYSLEALALSRKAGYRRGEAVSYSNLGWVTMCQGLYRDAANWATKSFEIKQAIGDQRGAGYDLTVLACALMEAGDYEEAAAKLQAAETLLVPLRDKQLLINHLAARGVLLFCRGQVQEARSIVEESLEAWKEVGNLFSVCEVLVILTEIALAENRLAEAERYREEYLRIIGPWGYAPPFDRFHEHYARLERRRGHFGEARVHLEKRYAQIQARTDRRGLVEWAQELAALLLDTARWGEAAAVLGFVRTMRTMWQIPVHPVYQPQEAARWVMLRENLEDALQEEALNKADSLDWPDLASLLRTL